MYRYCTRHMFLVCSMTEARSQRIRDPVHGLIVFRSGKGKAEILDQLAWSLLDTPEMQRLRRIKQLGMTEFVFPGATHSRFSHSIGVFHTARVLVQIIRRELPHAVNEDRVEVAILAALLHDLGHGPLSHTFEEVQKSRGKKKKHEVWSAEIVTSAEGEVRRLLENHRTGLAEEIATLLVTETPTDIYHAVVSSSFDADRLDYLRRDRMMTGTGAGAIDFDWLLDNLTVANIDMEADNDTNEDSKRPSFCLRHKAIQAAEAFLLARYHLYNQVYLHKTTRGMEQMMGALLRAVSEEVGKVSEGNHGLDPSHPLVRFFATDVPTISDYMKLDDAVIWSTVEHLQRSPDLFISKLARRILDRKIFKGLDLEDISGTTKEAQRKKRHRIDKLFKAEMGRTVLNDEPKLSIYGEIGAEDAKAQMRLMIKMPDIKIRIQLTVYPFQ